MLCSDVLLCAAPPSFLDKDLQDAIEASLREDEDVETGDVHSDEVGEHDEDKAEKEHADEETVPSTPDKDNQGNKKKRKQKQRKGKKGKADVVSREALAAKKAKAQKEREQEIKRLHDRIVNLQAPDPQTVVCCMSQHVVLLYHMVKYVFFCQGILVQYRRCLCGSHSS